MISIQHRRGHFTVEAEDQSDQSELSLPLHRIFLRSELQGDPDINGGRWIIPIKTDPIIPLRGIVDHFTKYGIEFVLDDGCRLILDAAHEQKLRFNRLLQTGLEAKKPMPGIYKGVERSLSDGFVRKLTELQIAAVRHLLAVENGANFSVPGSGKTSIALAYYHLLRKQNVVNGLLVIGPASCFYPWEQEYKLCFAKAPRSVRLAGNNRYRRRELLALSGRYEVLLTTYHSAARDIADLVKVLSSRPLLVILDESHYIKRPQGGKLAEAVLALAQYAKRRVILTGTPMPNGMADLWSQITFLWPEHLPLGTSDDFLRDIQQQNVDSTITKVRKRISPLFFRITKSQLQLPRPNFKTIKYVMSPLQKRIYLGIATRFLRQITEAPQDREALRDWRRARAIRLLQIAVNPTLLRRKCDEFRLPPLDLKGVDLQEAIEHYAKYEMPNKFTIACGLVRDLCDSGNKVLVWSTFVHNLFMLAEQLRRFKPVVVYGGVPYLTADSDEFSRETLLQRFREDPDCRVLIANPAACAESISLHMVCHHAIYLDRSFNCAHYLQSLDRIHRLGLPASVATCYYLLISADSLDEIVHSRLQEKMRLMRSVIEDDFPGTLPGYWSEDLGDEETLDLVLAEDHIKRLVSRHDS